MNIIKKDNKWYSSLSTRSATKYIVLHHRAGNGDVDSIHNEHLKNGYSGIGYHFYVRKDGQVFQGRPIDKIGAHCKGYNNKTIGICFEGNFESEAMSDKQIKAGQKLISYVKKIYPNISIKNHKDLFNTACPGRNFPIDEIIKGVNMKELTTVNDIVWELAHRGIITNKELWLKKLEEDTDSYWLARKCVNYIMNQK